MDDQEIKLRHYLEGLVKKEEALRKKYGIGDQYSVVANQFKKMLAYVDENLDLSQEKLGELIQRADVLEVDQQFVYVHLFHANGKQINRWANVLSPRNLVEYSVNRPIYENEEQVKAYIRSRPQVDEHAYIVVKINKSDVLPKQQLDILGQPLLKLKERSLQSDNLLKFVYKNESYQLFDGQLLPVS
jgi:hypothetical protein